MENISCVPVNSLFCYILYSRLGLGFELKCTILVSFLDVGFTGFSNYNFEENLKSEFTDDINFFVVFGVFFPTACGILAGVNMSGDLKDPGQNIPEGSIASLGLW